MTPSRDAVLDEAEALLREGGPAALSMRRLAERLGCSYQVVYSRVGGKGDLGRALHDRGFARLSLHAVGAADDAVAEGGTPAEVVERVAVGYVDHAIADPTMFEVMFGVPIEELVRDEEVHAVERRSFQRCWVEPVIAWQEANGVTGGRRGATATAYRLWTAAHGIATVHLAGHSSPSGDPRTEVLAVARLLLRAAAAHDRS